MKKAFDFRRDEAYIGVLIDDLITKDRRALSNVYFASRVQNVLRQDNADFRLTPRGMK
jgi:tRNA uridine 5-carboxymethylaminomethyl modification enzyme